MLPAGSRYWSLVISESWEHGPWFYFLIINKHVDGFDGFVKNVLA